MEKYKKICVRVNNGSGFIISSKSKERYYIITARHCITGKNNELDVDNIDIWTNILEEKIYFSVLDKFYDIEGEDIAIIEISDTIKISDNLKEKIENTNFYYEHLFLENLSDNNENLGMYGFPDHERDKACLERGLKELKILKYRVFSSGILIDKDDFTFSGNFDKSTYLNSYSGSGLFRESNENIFVCGVFFQYKGETGEAIKTNKLVELFEKNKLELPKNKDMLFLIETNKIIDNLCSKQLNKDPSSQDTCVNFRQKILKEINGLEKLCKATTKEETFFVYNEFLKTIIEFFFIINIYEKDFNLDIDKLSIIIENTHSSKLFKTKYKDEDYHKIKSEFNRYIWDTDYKVNDDDYIFIYDLSDIDNSPFICSECPYEESISSEKLKRLKEDGKITSDEILTDWMINKDTSNNLLTGGKKIKKIKIKCADCINLRKTTEKVENKIKGDKLWI